MSLINQTEQIINHIKNQSSRIGYNTRIFNILEGNLMPEILSSLRVQLSEGAYKIAKERVSPINILKRIVSKLSRIYSDPAQRTATTTDGDKSIKTDQELIDWYVSEIGLDTYMSDSNKFFNALKYVAIQIYYIDDKKEYKVPRVRIIPPHKFTVMTNDDIDPTNPTIFIVYKDSIIKENDKKEQRLVQTFDVYTDNEFLPIDEDGDVIPNRAVEGNINPYETIPFVYVNRSRQELIPQIDSDTMQMSILLPILLSDLNFAVQFMSHSILYGIDIEPGKLDLNPHAFWSVKGVEREGATPSIGVLKPDVDVDKVLNLIKNQLGLWLETRNIKPGKAGTFTAESVATGIALMIEEADTTEDRKEQVNYFRDAEEMLFDKITIMHEYYIDELEDKRQFSENFDMSIQYSEQKVVEDKGTKIDRIDKEIKARLNSRRRGIKELNPYLDDEEIDKIIEEIEEENAFEVEEIEPFNNTTPKPKPDNNLNKEKEKNDPTAKKVK